MFEDSLIDSSGRIKTQSKYYTVVGILLNTTVLATMILVPLVYPEALPKQAMSTLLVAPPPPPPQPAPQPAQLREPKAKAVSEILENSIVAPSIIPPHAKIISSDSTLLSSAITDMGEGSGAGIKAMATILSDSATSPVIRQATARKTIVSSGVMQGYLLSRITPIYPAIARAAHISGTVVMQATISKTGLIVNLHVLSGSPMLQQTAMEAVRQWRYKPYLLNGEPVEVETEINVIFNLGG